MRMPFNKIMMVVFVFAAIGFCSSDSMQQAVDTAMVQQPVTGTLPVLPEKSADSTQQAVDTAMVQQPVTSALPATTKQAQEDSSWMLPVLRWIHVLPDSAVIHENVGEIFVGENFYLKADPHFDHNHIGWSGTEVGIALPLRLPFIIMHYEIKAYFHQAINGDMSLTYVNGANEIVIGKAISFGRVPLEFAPQLGVGFDNGITARVLDARIKGMETHYFWYADYGLAIRIPIRGTKLRFFSGILIDYERAFAPNEDTKQRLNVRLIVGY